MLSGPSLKTLQIEAVLGDYLVRANIQPRGLMLIYLNEKRWPFLPLIDAEIYPMSMERQVNVIKQPSLVVNKNFLKIVCMTDEAEAGEDRLLPSKRPVAVYTGLFIIQGKLHVNMDARSQDLLDETKDFFAVSEASIYPIVKVMTPPTRHVPVLYFSRELVQAYHLLGE